jgi:hypothetical protein
MSKCSLRAVTALIVAIACAFALAGCSGTRSAGTGAAKPDAAAGTKSSPATASGTAMEASSAATSTAMTMKPDMKPEKMIVKTASIESGVQRISVDLTSGTYVPNKVVAKAGMPLEITFGQGKGCVKMLVFPSFNIKADMTKGPQTFKLGPLAVGDYKWACGMDMKHGVIEVR